MKDERGLIKQWEDIAIDAVKSKNLSRSELDSILIGIRQSKNVHLKSIIEEMRTKAWKAKSK